MSGIIVAALWMTGALVSFMSMAIAGRELSAELGTFEILFFRSAIGLLVVCAVLSRAGWHHIKTEHFGLHLIRNIAHYVGQYGWFFAISLIPLAQVFALEFTVPIWMALFAPLLLGERVTLLRALVIAIGFSGILIILRPGMVPLDIGTLSALIGALGYALAHTLTKKITRTDSPLAVIFFMTVLQLPMGAVPSAFEWITPTTAMYPWLLVVGVTALSAHYCLARAFAHADAVVVIPMDFLRLPLIAVVGLVVYHEPLDPWVLAGAAVICGGIFLSILKEL